MSFLNLRTILGTTHAVVVGAALVSMQVVLAQGDVETKKVSESIYMITGKGGNIGVLLGADGTFMIDDKFSPMSDAILAALNSIGGDTPKFLINTHFHGDHTGGNENFGKAGSTIVAHDNVRKRLADGSTIKAFGMETPPGPKPALPVVTFSSAVGFHLNEDHIEIFHVPNAHTDGDAVVHFTGANVIHTGDLFFNGYYPFIDVDNGGTLQGMIAAVDQILALGNSETKIIPGHGPLASVADLTAYRDMLVVVRDRLVTLKSQGKSVDEIVGAEPLGDLEAEWGDGIFTGDKWISVIFDGI